MALTKARLLKHDFPVHGQTLSLTTNFGPPPPTPPQKFCEIDSLCSFPKSGFTQVGAFQALFPIFLGKLTERQTLVYLRGGEWGSEIGRD